MGKAGGGGQDGRAGQGAQVPVQGQAGQLLAQVAGEAWRGALNGPWHLASLLEVSAPLPSSRLGPSCGGERIRREEAQASSMSRAGERRPPLMRCGSRSSLAQAPRLYCLRDCVLAW